VYLLGTGLGCRWHRRLCVRHTCADGADWRWARRMGRGCAGTAQDTAAGRERERVARKASEAGGRWNVAPAREREWPLRGPAATPARLACIPQWPSGRCSSALPGAARGGGPLALLAAARIARLAAGRGANLRPARGTSAPCQIERAGRSRLVSVMG
jgi:hypothetical protein